MPDRLGSLLIVFLGRLQKFILFGALQCPLFDVEIVVYAVISMDEV
jgi:hypothetical protein